MDRTKRAMRWTMLGMGLAAVFGLGCSPSTLWYLMRGDEKKPPQYPLAAKDGRKEVVVAVAVTAPPDLMMNPATSGIDLELAAKLGNQLTALAAANKEATVRVLDQTKVLRYKQADPNRWDTTHPSKLAKGLGADYLIEVNLSSFSLYDKDQFAKEMCHGSATATVCVYDAGATGEEPLHNYGHVSNDSLRDTSSTPAHMYRATYVGKVATEIAIKHVKHTAEQEEALRK